MACAVCGEPLPEGAKFCPNCGAAVATAVGTEERKMVTVLFADLVDSTGLARRLDPERAREVLGQFFDTATSELQALRGRPEKFIGDAVMAVFGLPTVGEDDALRAVRAGLAIRGRLRRLSTNLGLAEPLRVRVGVESGEAATGMGPSGQFLVTGPVVHAAARLQTAAEPGEVLVGETTFALTETAVSYGPRRDVPAKGFDVELAGYSVESLTTRSARRTIPFVGRDSEVTILRESVSHAGATGQPVLVTVLGEAGIGKSRLADELAAGLGDSALPVIGRAPAYTDTTTFAPASAIVAELAGVREGEGLEETRRRLRDALGGRLDPAETERAVDRLLLLFGLARQRPEAAFVHNVQAGFLALVDSMSQDRTLVLVFEDAHTFKQSMLDLVERVATVQKGRRRRAMVLAVGRPELLDRRPGWGSRAEGVLLRLGPLTDDESVDLVRQASGGRIDEVEAGRIAARAGGNPFFIIETTGILCSDEGDITGSLQGPLPPTVQALVSARLDTLPPRLRVLARRASVFFVSFDVDELARIDPEATPDEIRRLEDAEILVREEPGRASPHGDGGANNPRWRVRHSTLKEVAYASLPKRERVRLHQLIAQNLIARGHPSWAADHLERAAQASLDLAPGDRSVAEQAGDALLAAGDRARRRMESRSAIDFYRRALALAGSEDRWGVREARALAGEGEAHYWLADYRTARDVLERAAALGADLDDAWTQALALRYLGDIAINVEADLDKAGDLLDRSLAAAEEVGDPWVIVRTLLFAGWVPWTRNRMDEAETIWQRALDLADPEDGWARVRALNSLSINRSGGPRAGALPEEQGEEALRLSEEANALAEEIGDQFSIAMTTVQRARVLEELGRFDEALAGFERAMAVFDDLGARWEYADALAERGVTRRELGLLDEAEADLRGAIGISEELGERQLASWTWKALARVAELRGDQALADEHLARSRQADEDFARQRDPDLVASAPSE